jgi:hypothetical protein
MHALFACALLLIAWFTAKKAVEIRRVSDSMLQGFCHS